MCESTYLKCPCGIFMLSHTTPCDIAISSKETDCENQTSTEVTGRCPECRKLQKRRTNSFKNRVSWVIHDAGLRDKKPESPRPTGGLGKEKLKKKEYQDDEIEERFLVDRESDDEDVESFFPKEESKL
ncbi:hypothetical protein ABW19_dt0204140 [Dactylella cylindrospora]|nr:hypothetical protein ABW19_dt0204140 [Dactylella cylindrospora]